MCLICGNLCVFKCIDFVNVSCYSPFEVGLLNTTRRFPVKKIFLKNPIGYIFIFFKRLLWNNFYADLYKNSSKSALIDSLKGSLKSGDVDLEKLRVSLLFRFSDTLEDLVFFVENGELPYNARRLVSEKIMDCMSTSCEKEFIHLYASQLRNPKRYLFFFRLAKAFPPHLKWYFKRRANFILDTYEFCELINVLK